MATYTQPGLVPRWADVGGNIVAQTEGQKDTGWTNGQIPPSGGQNEWQNLVGAWFFWLRERIMDGVDEDELQLNDIAGGIRAVALDAAGLRILKGLVVGFDAAPADDTIAIGDATCKISNDGALVTLTFDSNDFMEYDRASNTLRWVINSVDIFTLTEAGITPGVPFTSIEVTGDVKAGGTVFHGTQRRFILAGAFQHSSGNGGAAQVFLDAQSEFMHYDMGGIIPVGGVLDKVVLHAYSNSGPTTMEVLFRINSNDMTIFAGGGTVEADELLTPTGVAQGDPIGFTHSGLDLEFLENLGYNILLTVTDYTAGITDVNGVEIEWHHPAP